MIAYQGHQVSGKCGNRKMANTDWAACLPAVGDDLDCPHNFLKLGSGSSACGVPSFPTGLPAPEDSKPSVCCLLTPVANLKVIKTATKQVCNISQRDAQMYDHFICIL
jgi:hypothetical protein